MAEINRVLEARNRAFADEARGHFGAITKLGRNAATESPSSSSPRVTTTIAPEPEKCAIYEWRHHLIKQEPDATDAPPVVSRSRLRSR